MLGFAIVDRHSTASATAVWLTTHAGGTAVQHTNAVVIQNADEEYEKKLRALTADRVVVLTPGSDDGELFSASLSLSDLSEMTAETMARQQLIADAIASYASETKNKNLVFPEYPQAPHAPAASSVEPQLRALAVANYVAAVWSRWLATEEQRLRRTTDPRTGKPPWIMPEGLAHPALAVLPPGFSAAVVPEPLSKSSGFC